MCQTCCCYKLEAEFWKIIVHGAIEEISYRLFPSEKRLQIEERYKCLRPLVKTLNQVSKEQKQCNEDVERLLRELSEARTREQQLHDNLVKSVRELAQGKEKIDSSRLVLAVLRLHF